MNGRMIGDSFIETLIERFDGPDVDALVLMGSYARGTADLYSDIDLARFTSAHGEHRTRIFQGLIADQLVMVPSILGMRFSRAKRGKTAYQQKNVLRLLSDVEGLPKAKQLTT